MAYIDIKNLKVDKEFEDLLPVLTPEELEKLENNILQYGMLDPIKIWQEPDTGEWIIIDGHNRYNILKKHKINWHYWQDYKIMGELETREDVKQWMLEQQLGRCHDNARCESMWARMKEELIYGRHDTERMTVEELKTLIWRYFISYWNNRRICSANDGLPPMVKRQRYYGSLGSAA